MNFHLYLYFHLYVHFSAIVLACHTFSNATRPAQEQFSLRNSVNFPERASGFPGVPWEEVVVKLASAACLLRAVFP